MRAISHALSLLIGASCLVSCATGPEYAKPQVFEPAQFKEALAIWQPAQPSDQLDRGNWWKGFQSNQLSELIEQGTLGNFQIAAAVSRYNAARAFLDVNDAALSPQLGIAGAATNNRQSAQRPLRGANQPDIYDNNALNAVASYELDLWGKLQSGVDSASALSQASRADLESVRLLIQADIAIAFFNIHGVDSQIGVVRQSIAAYQRQVRIIASRRREGVTSGADLYRVQTLVETEEVKLKGLQTRRAQLEHALAVLIGVAPEQFTLEPGDVFAIHLPSTPQAVPSKMLERRTDIASNERRVAATQADIGVAKAAFFPSITLAGVAGYQNASTNNLINAPDRFWTIGPAMFLTLFDAGKRDALVRQAEARQAEATANYKNSVLNAFREVEDLLVDLNNRQQSQLNLERGVAFSTKNYNIATARYKEGIASYLEIVDAAVQKSQLELQLADQKTQMLVGCTALVKALGGYWE